MEAFAYRLGGLVVDALYVAVFALTFRSFWKARPRPMPDVVAWMYVAFSAVALAVGLTLSMFGFDFRASYLAVLFIAVIGFVTAHNWPRTQSRRASTVVACVTLAVVAVILLGVIASAAVGADEVRVCEARIDKIGKITEAGIARFATVRHSRQRSKIQENTADPLARWGFPDAEWRLSEAGLDDVVSARPGQELATYRRAYTAAQLQLDVARGNVTASLWYLVVTLGLVALIGVSLARTVEGLTRKSRDFRRRDRRPALMVGLVSLAGFFIAISFMADARTEVFWRALSVAVGTGLLATAALVYRRLNPRRGHDTSDRNSQDQPPTPPTTP